MSIDEDERRRELARARLQARLDAKQPHSVSSRGYGHAGAQGRASGRRIGHSNGAGADARGRASGRSASRANARGRADNPTNDWRSSLSEATLSVGNALSSAFSQLAERFGIRNLAIGIAAIAVVLVLICVGVSRCSAPSQETATSQSEQTQAAEQGNSSSVALPSDDGAAPDESALANLLGADDAKALLARADDDPAAYWAAAHASLFDADGTAVQGKLLRLIANEPAADEFVVNWPQRYPQNAGQAVDADELETHSASAGVDVPRLYQWDTRWGYTVYSSTSFALTGCCPTALSMVYMGLTGKTDKTPYDMAQLATRDGYATEYSGTDGSLLVNEAPSLGLSCQTISVDAASLKSAFDDGKIVIVNVGPGDFTEGGHFFVALGLDDAGKLVINDPYSQVRSDKAWDVNTVLGQTIALYAFGKA